MKDQIQFETNWLTVLQQAQLRYPKGSYFYKFGIGAKRKRHMSTGDFRYSELNHNDLCLNDKEGTYVYQDGVWADGITA